MDCSQGPLQLQAFALSPCNNSKGWRLVSTWICEKVNIKRKWVFITFSPSLCKCRWSTLPRRSSPQILHRLYGHGLCIVHNIHKYSLLSHLGAFASALRKTIRRRRRRGPMAVQLETFQSQRLLGTVNAKVSLSTGVLLFGGGEYFASLVKKAFHLSHIHCSIDIFNEQEKSFSTYQ